MDATEPIEPIDPAVIAEVESDLRAQLDFVHEQMRELVAAGNLGAKTGKGFYEHSS